MDEDYQSLLEQTYLAETGRAPDPEGAAYWGNLLSTGQITPDQLSAAFSGTPEGTAFDARAGLAGIAGLANTSFDSGGGGYQGDSSGVAAQVDALYQSTFNRPADMAGLQYYGNALMSGASLADIEQSLKASAEYAGLQPETTGTTGTTGTVGGAVGGTSLESDLAKYYQSEFGREFDKPGLDFWAGKIRSGEVALGDVAKLFSTSPEGLRYDIANLAAGKTDQGFIDPSLKGRYETLQDLYQKEAYRPGDMPGLEYWLGQNLTNEQYAKAFAESPEARVQDAFREVFGTTRGADPEGLKFYMNQLAAGKKYTDIVADMKKSDEYKKLIGDKKAADTKTLVTNTATGVRYSNPSELAKSMNFGNFPLTAGTRTNERGEIVPTVGLNLRTRPKFNLGLPGFSTLGLTSYQQDPSSTNVFGGPGMFGGATGTTATPSVVDAAATTDQGVVTAAEGGMVMSDPVMRRAMFRQPGPVSSKGYGITSNVTTPDENAMAMQTMFQPPGFRDGGPVQYFQQGGEAVEEPARRTPLERLRAQTRTSEPRFRSVMDVYREGRMLPIDREQEYTGQSMRDLEEGVNPSPPYSMRDVVRDTARGVGDAVRGSTQGIGDFFDSIAERAKRNREAMAPGLYTRRRPQPEYDPADASTKKAETEDLQRQARAQMAERREAIDEREGLTLTRPEIQERREERAPDPERRVPERASYKLEIEKLKAEREANKAQRKENQLLALMQAGFAMAAGRSPNALANLAAGGASGVATLAGLEKDRRAEDTALRREILERELAGERMSESRAERQAAREDRALSREQLGLRSQAEINARREGQIENTRLRLEALVNNPLVPDTEKTRYRSQLEALDRELERRALEESRFSRAILPPGMRQGSGGFPVRELGSSPTPQR
jgi:hypothetical protein